MKQIIQNLKNGNVEIADVPFPKVSPGKILIRTVNSLISVGTERMLVEFGKSNLIAKAKQQPDKVKQVIDKIKTDGIITTLNSVRSRLDEPMPLGYCNAGEVMEVGEGVTEFKIGDRVVSNGPHAEYVVVPKNLCVKIPENVEYKDAAFTVLGSIGLQGVRLAQPTIGETFVVIGLGLIGQLTVQILKANGCRVLGLDINQERVKLAEKFGVRAFNLNDIDNPVQIAMSFSNDKGVDGILITASTKSNEPIHQAAQMCRKKGRIILVGVTGLNLNRADFYEKELTFQVSCSYGPGRYDENYEMKGNDYPIGFVRWTEQRNFQTILDLMSAGKLDVKSLITDIFDFNNSKKAYGKIISGENVLGVILDYSNKKQEENSIVKHKERKIPKDKISEIIVGTVGAGNFAKMILYPALKHTSARLKTVADLNPVAAVHAARKFGFENSCTDYMTIFRDTEINTIFIATRHNFHSRLVIEGLKAGKNVYVEKPLALNKSELQQIYEVYEASNRKIMVGFNRRFAPQVLKMKELLKNRCEPIAITILVNSGIIPAQHWVHDPDVGGGRIIGEGCHFIDLISFLADSPITSVSAFALGGDRLYDKVTMNLTLKDGSIGSMHYFSNGNKRYPKETIHVFSEGKILELINFRKLRGCGWKGFSKYNLWKQDKGHNVEVSKFVENLTNEDKSLIPFDQLYNVTLASFAVIASINTGSIINI